MLYNPYYRKAAIKEHIDKLKKTGKVAFGKLKAPNKSYEHPFLKELLELYEGVSCEEPLQLFLSDYANLFVAKVVQADGEDLSSFAPWYYRDYEVEQWFLITDLRELVRDDFTAIRDKYLANFSTPCYEDRTYSLYGGRYDFPLIVEQKNELCYFSEDEVHYTDIYKCESFLETKKNLIKYSFGSHYIYDFHPDSLESIVYAVMEYELNEDDEFYDFSGVLARLARAVETELVAMVRKLTAALKGLEPSIESALIGGKDKASSLGMVLSNKLQVGNCCLILKNTEVLDLLSKTNQANILKDLKELSEELKVFRDIRNKNIHSITPRLAPTRKLVDMVLGKFKPSIIARIIKLRERELKAPLFWEEDRLKSKLDEEGTKPVLNSNGIARLD